jgi:hypothetical protein
MGGFAVGNLITLARSQSKTLAVGESGYKFAFEAEEDVSFGTPMIRRIAGRVFYDPNANLAEVSCAPEGHAGLAGMLGRNHLSPIRGGEREPRHLHGTSIATSPQGRDSGAAMKSEMDRLPHLARVIYTYGLP